MIKPEFFDSESLAYCSIGARLTFIGLWVTSDDYGNQKAQLTRIQHRIFPYDKMAHDDFLDMLCELEEVGCIKGYEIDGERYITVPNFNAYQTVRKPSSTNVPEPPKSTVKCKTTRVIRGWRNGTSPVAHDDGSESPVRHHDDTSIPEVMNERSKGVLTNSFAKEELPCGADAEGSAPPDNSKVPSCPLCSQRLRFDPSTLKWRCDLCGEVKEPVYREAVA